MEPVTGTREDWLAARLALLEAEKDLVRHSDKLAEQRRQLPWVKLDKTYTFDTSEGKRTLADLFEGRSQLMVQHFMLGPGWKAGCPSCSFMADHVDGVSVHLANRDVMFVAVSRAPLAEIEAFQRRMGWQFRWVSSNGSDFNFDFHVSFTPEEEKANEVYYNFDTQPFECEELPGISIFHKDEAGEVYHTYSTYRRGVEVMIGAYALLDLMPNGRGERDVPNKMEWVRHHDSYTAE